MVTQRFLEAVESGEKSLFPVKYVSEGVRFQSLTWCVNSSIAWVMSWEWLFQEFWMMVRKARSLNYMVSSLKGLSSKEWVM